jgi:hypothetical protein
MTVLAETILETTKDLSRERQLAIRDGQHRRERAVELALFKLKLLMCHVHKSRRILNDLRMIRRLMMDERETIERVLAAM